MIDRNLRQLTAIDLFSGCGGLSLGLELNGFKTLLFSEINKHASETYLANRQDKDIVSVSDIYTLTNSKLNDHLSNWESKGFKEIDLVAGGPPCQGYSKIGHRRTFKLEKEEIPSNQLFKEMIRIIKVVQPRMFLFENVSGLLTAKWNKTGKKGEIFVEVLNSFINLQNYEVRWELVHAKDYGTPQNRPRVLIIGVRKNLKLSIPRSIKNETTIILPTAIKDGLLPEPNNDYPTIVELLGDLVDPRFENGGKTAAYPHSAVNKFQKLLRKRLDGTIAKKGAALTEHEYSFHKEKIVNKFSYMISHNGEIAEEMKTKKFAQRLLPKKWGHKGPNITATSMPDDFVHFSQPRILSVREWARLQMFPDWYHFKGPRTTGGRRRAGDPDAGLWDRDVPRYTQIGNAVPVSLSSSVGKHLSKLLRHLP